MQQNFLSPNGFKFTIKRLPHVSFFVQSATVPGINAGTTVSPTPFKNIKLAGDKIEHDPLIVSVRLDEYMQSYTEIFNWMIGLSKNDSYDQYKALKESDDGLYSDASLIILNSKGNPGVEVRFKDIFPTSLGSIMMNTTETDVNYVTCEITFEHNGHTIHGIG